MAEAAAGIGMVSSLASAGFKYSATLQESEGQSAAYQFQAQQEARSAKYGKLAAQQSAAKADQMMAQSGGLRRAVMSANNLDPTSPTFIAVSQGARQIEEIDRNILRHNMEAQAAEFDMASKYHQQMAGYALDMGSKKAMAGLFGGIGGLFGSLGGMK